MRLRIVLSAAAFAALLAGPARAEPCAAMLEKIDPAAAKARLSPAQKAEVERLRDEGRELCERGDDGQAAEKLAEAEDILGLR